MKNRQNGFTLIEIAIVLVIIGLLLGGILKGQELINSAKVKNLAQDFKNIPVYVYAFQDRFRALPGDDVAAATHVTGATNASTPAGLQGNGVVNGNWNSTTTTDESFLFWQHVRLAGLAPGPTNTADATYAPTNSEGGRLGIQSNVGFASITGPTAMTGTYIICSAGILGRFVLQLDTTLDDGNPQTGSLRSILSSAIPGDASTAATVNANEANAFTVCMGI
ncbi:MAG: prepilin-type N-terminal cleavage/methylation domain-containing protein [Betaproteobacteria bacterium]|nr:prepilin-type N-terminal cleavage/methylation domain-containing protein [Betaproteobacteria bacterium]